MQFVKKYHKAIIVIGLLTILITGIGIAQIFKNNTKQPQVENVQNGVKEEIEENDVESEIIEETQEEEQEDSNTTSDTSNSNAIKPNTNNSAQNNNTTTSDNTTKPNTSDDTQSNNTTKPDTENNTTNEVVNGNTQDNQVTQKAILCDAWDDINIIYPNQSFITNDYDYYVFDTESLYSNNQNCKKLNPEGVKIKRCLRGYCIAEDNRIYNYNMENVDAPWMQNSFQNNTIILQDTYATLKNDGKIYLSDYEMYDEDEILLEIEINDENIIMFYGITRRLAPIIIKTNKAFYVYNSYIANEEECQKYKDIECKLVQEYVKEPTLSQHYQNIVWVNDKVYITKDKKIHYY